MSTFRVILLNLLLRLGKWLGFESLLSLFKDHIVQVCNSEKKLLISLSWQCFTENRVLRDTLSCSFKNLKAEDFKTYLLHRNELLRNFSVLVSWYFFLQNLTIISRSNHRIFFFKNKWCIFCHWKSALPFNPLCYDNNLDTYLGQFVFCVGGIFPPKLSLVWIKVIPHVRNSANIVPVMFCPDPSFVYFLSSILACTTQMVNSSTRENHMNRGLFCILSIFNLLKYINFMESR